MVTTGLGQDFVARLNERQSTTPPERAQRAANTTRLLLQHAISSHDAHPHLSAAPALVAELTGLPLAEAELLVGLAHAPEHRPASGSEDLASFEARFGPQAARRLLEQEAQETDLCGYGLAWGPEAALALLDAMTRLAAADERLTADELRRLEAAAEELAIDPGMAMALVRRHAPDAASRGEPIPLRGERIVIGRAPGSGIHLPHPQVAPHHADLIRGSEGWRVVDARSGRATVVDGRAVRSAPLREGQELRLGPYRLRLEAGGEFLRVRGEVQAEALSVRDLSRRIGEVSLLDDLSFTAFTGEVIAVVGPSGAGKTTLLNAITGQAPADQGRVLFEGQDFHSLLARDLDLVGSVPQDDIVLPELTVEESLLFGARLRLRGEEALDPQEPVDRVLGELGIPHIRHSRIGDALRRGISGGQRKRVNVGQEVISESARVLFLDEPTSGLDPRSAGDIARTARRLADSGRIVVLVTHDLSASVLAQVDHLLVMVEGGRVAWFGPPADACRMFDVAIPVELFDRLGQQSPATWARTYAASPAARRWVELRTRILATELLARPAALSAQTSRPGRLRTLKTLIARYALVKVRDRAALLVLAMQPLLLAAVMVMVFPRPTASLVFLLSLSALWFGMSGSVRELIADRAIWRRECRVGVGVTAWLGSKLLVLSVLVALQCLVMTLLVFAGCDLSSAGFQLHSLIPAIVVAGWSGVATGLLMSALWSRSEAAVGSVVLLLVPQIAFSGIMMPLDKLSAPARALAGVNPARYAFQLALRCGESMQYLNALGEWKSRPMTGELYTLGLRSPEPGGLGMAPALLLGVLTVQILVQIGVSAALLQRMKPRRRAR